MHFPLLILLAATPLAFFTASAFARPGEIVTGSGRIVTQTRAVSGYQAVAVDGALNVVLRQIGREGVEVRADDNLQALIETKVVKGRNGGTLEIGPKEGASFSNEKEIVVTVDLISLRSLTLGGSGDATGHGIKTELLDVVMGGAGDVRLPDLKAGSLKVSIAGSGTFEASGRGSRFEIEIAGSGDVNAERFDADDVTVGIAGSGNANVKANKTLKVSIAGSGDVTYSGDAKVARSIAGSGSVARR